jgi:multiple sugar transport system ATP-binding protein
MLAEREQSAGPRAESHLVMLDLVAGVRKGRPLGAMSSGANARASHASKVSQFELEGGILAGLAIQGISKSFGATSVLDRVSLEVKDGEFLTLLGPSGCGKSTLLRIIAGLERQDFGTISIGGRVVDDVRPKRRDVAMVFQSYALYPHMTVAQNIAVPLRMRRLNAWQRLPLAGRLFPGAKSLRAGIAKDVDAVATALEIGGLLGRKPAQLSGGQRQRVAVARAMVREPAVFLMDEPLSNLDAKLRVAMRTEIAELHRRLGATFIYVTHDQSEAMTMSDRVAVMLGGELLQVAPPQKIYSDPADRRVAEFIGSPRINLLEGIVRGDGSVDVAGTSVPSPMPVAPGTKISFGIRPEALELRQRGSPGTISGRVRLVEHLGSDIFVHLDVVGGAPIILRTSPDRGAEVRPGSQVGVAVARASALFFDEGGRRLRPETPQGDASVAKVANWA